MVRFWNWMALKGNISTHMLSCVDSSSFVVHDNGVIYFGTDCKNRMPMHMMIGYMFQYLMEEFQVNDFHISEFGVKGVYDKLSAMIEFRESQLKGLVDAIQKEYKDK